MISACRRHLGAQLPSPTAAPGKVDVWDMYAVEADKSLQALASFANPVMTRRDSSELAGRKTSD
jgi:hypothetical protein